jgi:hypothetical protein
MSNKKKIIIGIILAVVIFALGRYSATYSSKTESTKSTADEKKSSEKEEESKKKKQTRKEITRPDGTKEVIIVDEEETKKKKSDTDSSKKSETSTEKKEVVSGSKSRLTLSVLGGTKLSFSGEALTPVYGGMISKDLIGPINMGLFGLSNGLAGVSLGVSF